MAREYSLPDSSYDEYNREHGNDDHGLQLQQDRIDVWHVVDDETIMCSLGCDSAAEFSCTEKGTHVYCRKCIEMWNNNSSGTCPACRKFMHF